MRGPCCRVLPRLMVTCWVTGVPSGRYPFSAVHAVAGPRVPVPSWPVPRSSAVPARPGAAGRNPASTMTPGQPGAPAAGVPVTVTAPAGVAAGAVPAADGIPAVTMTLPELASAGAGAVPAADGIPAVTDRPVLPGVQTRTQSTCIVVGVMSAALLNVLTRIRYWGEVNPSVFRLPMLAPS